MQTSKVRENSHHVIGVAKGGGSGPCPPGDPGAPERAPRGPERAPKGPRGRLSHTFVSKQLAELKWGHSEL